MRQYGGQICKPIDSLHLDELPSDLKALALGELSERVSLGLNTEA